MWKMTHKVIGSFLIDFPDSWGRRLTPSTGCLAGELELEASTMVEYISMTVPICS